MKVIQFQIEPGEPYLLIRGNDRFALEVVTHRLAKMSVDQSVPSVDVVAAAELTNAFRDWKERKP